MRMSRPAGSPTSGAASRSRWPVPALAAGLLVLTFAIAAGWWPVSLDHRLAAALPGQHAAGLPSVLLDLASVITTLATPQATVPITLVVAAALAWRDRNAAALRIVAVPLMALTISVLAGKALLHRPGPAGSHLHHLLGYYPSGHTTTAVVCTGLLTRLAHAHHLGSRVPLRAAAITWTLLVGTSLVLHRYHWLSDVIAGLLLGILILHLTRPRQQHAGAAKQPRAGFSH
jgi:membrane-associated phospholipid phosphatase